MKILKANAGALSNLEVFDFLQSRGAGTDLTRIIASVSTSEIKVYDYLKESAASRQTRESIREFVEKSKKYNLAKAEVLNIINITPSSLVEIDPIVEDVENRMEESAEELAELVLQVFPPPLEEKTDVPDGQQIEIEVGRLFKLSQQLSRINGSENLCPLVQGLLSNLGVLH